MPRRGLPQTAKMRHDEHYVDTLATKGGRPIGRIVPIEEVDPNPDQPRQVMGDLSELMASVAEKGIIEPLIVRTRNSRYQIIAGERRYQAAVRVGIKEVPVIVREIDDAEVVELARVENIQRKDLTAFEEAEALDSLVDQYNHTHEILAKRLGKSRTSITESLALNKVPGGVENLCRLADINSKSLLLQVVREKDTNKMTALIERITRAGGITREQVRKQFGKPKSGRAQPFVFQHRDTEGKFQLKLQFKKSKVSREELVVTLEAIVDELRGGNK